MINDGPQPPPRRVPTGDEALTALHAQVAALAHELEVLRHDHQQLHAYHHHLRFRLAEKANVLLHSAPALHRLLRQSLVAAQAFYRRCRHPTLRQ
jgi:hypothetical protein